jgi:hypothetical protein
MAELKSNSFNSWNLTEDEHLQGSVLSLNQRQVIDNLVSIAAEEKLLLSFDPKNPELFMQQEASLKGQILILQYILAASEGAVEELKARPQAPEIDQQLEYDSPFTDEVQETEQHF